MKRTLSLLLALLLLLPCLCAAVLPVGAEANVTARQTAEKTEGISGVREISFSKNGVGGTPYMSGLNSPVGYAFTLDPEVRLLQINVPEFATYSNNVNRGTFKLYAWKGDRNTTVAHAPILEREIVNHEDHRDLVLDIPAEDKITGALYFEIICLEGTSYTPWNAEGGLIDPIPGVVTDMQAYLNGNPHTPFACTVTVCDMVDKSPSSFVTFTYDFAKGLAEGADYSQTNQIRIENRTGYVTFTAEGDDPYFRFSDNYQPTVTTEKLAYAVIEYRTTASIAAGEFFTNRKSGAHWGDPNAYVTWSYIPDGEWHTALVDASAVWGEQEGDELYAFRFDPLTSGAKTGDSIDVASIRFFADGVNAKAYAAEREASIREDEQLAIAENSEILDFCTGMTHEGMTASDTVTVYTQKDFVRLYAAAPGEVTLSGLSVPTDYPFIKVVYRTKEAVSLGLSVGYGDLGETHELLLAHDGYWEEVTLTLNAEGGQTVDSLTVALPEGWVDLAFIGFFGKAEYAGKYIFPRELNTHEYILAETSVPVYNVTSTTLGDPFCGGGESYGQKFTASFGVRGIIVPGHATWGADPANNQGTFRLYQWNRDYATTTGGTPLVERELKNLKDGEDLTVTFDELPAGEYCFVVNMTTPSDKAYTGFTSKDGGAMAGTVSFRNGNVNHAQLVAGYLTTGIGMKDVGGEYAMDMTYEYGFAAHFNNVTEEMQLRDVTGMTLPDICNQGYLPITATGKDPHFTFGISPAVSSNLLDHIVIKYRATATGLQGELFAERTDGAAWGEPDGDTHVSFDIVANGEWQLAVIDASSIWGDVYDVELKNIRFDPLEGNVTEGDTVDVAYIKFFANRRAANTFAESEYVTENGKTTVKPPVRPLDPETVSPVLLLDGEALSVSGGSQMKNSQYSYEKGYVTLTPTGADPNYFLLRESTRVAPFMAIRYRTTTRGVQGEIHAASVGSTPNGRTDRLTFDYNPDGQWHTAVVDLQGIAAYDAATHTLTYLRFDFFCSESGMPAGAALEVEYIAFFEAADEAEVYRHTIPTRRALRKATFVVNGEPLYVVEFRAGDTTLTEPVVPHVPGMIGRWEPYTLGDEDITVHAVYTPDGASNVPDMPDMPGEETSAPTPDTEGEDGTEGGDSTQSGGCKSVLDVGFVALLLTAAVGLVKKKE